MPPWRACWMTPVSPETRRSLRWRIPLLATLPVVVAMLLGVAAASLYSRWHAADQEAAAATRARAAFTAAVARAGAELAGTVADYSAWDAAERFLRGAHPGFIGGDLTPAALSRLRLRAVTLVDAAGRPALAWERVGGSIRAADDAFAASSRLAPVLTAARQAPVHGLVWHAGGPALLAAAPVTRSDGSGPAAGCFVFLADLDTDRIAGLAAMAGVTAARIAAPGSPDDGGLALPLLEGGTAPVSLTPAPRADREARMMAASLAGGVLVGGGIAAALVAWLVHRLLLRRILALARAAEAWAAGRGGAPEEPDDELGGLARALHAQFAASAAARARAEAADQDKGALIAMLSHDLRSPLTGVLGMADLLRGDRLDPLQRMRVDVIHRSGEQLLALLNDLLELARIEAGRLALDPAPCAPAALVREVCELFRPTLADGVALAVEIDARLPARITVDSVRLRQILWNLVGNAAKFTRTGHVRVTARLEPSPGDAAPRLVMAVEDTGPGMDADERARLFTPFRQGDAGRRHGGTGLGLSICARMAELMGGTLSVDSAPGRGSAFTVRIPVAIPPPGSAYGPLRVLICDDDAVAGAVVSALIADLGHEATIVTSGGSALERCRCGRFDVLLLDYLLPDLDGAEVVRRLRAQPGAPRVIGASAGEEERRRLAAAGVGTVLAKPLRPPDLAAAFAP